MRLSNSAKMRIADHAAIYERGIASTKLMENAAKHLLAAVRGALAPEKSVAIFCGCGNNGGDGIALAYMLVKKKIAVTAYLVGERSKMTPDSQEMEYRFGKLGHRLVSFDENTVLAEDCGVIVDAMFGIGLNSPLYGKALIATKLINSKTAYVISADIPTGVVADTGYVHEEAVRADLTVTFSAGKPAHFVEPGCTYCGEVRICDIGIPEDLLQGSYTDVHVICAEEMKLPKRRALSHKYTYGRLGIFGGALGYTGAVSLTTKAALRAGAGVVATAVPNSVYSIVAAKNDEAIVFPLVEELGKFCTSSFEQVRERLSSYKAVVIGPGLDRGAEVSEFVYSMILNSPCTMVLDADALYALKDGTAILRMCSKEIILTPHEGEFKNMGGVLSDNRIADARSFAQNFRCTLLLKGHHSIVAFPDGEVYICPYGNAGMAKGGSGDVLAGIIGAMLCSLPTKQAVITAMYIHSATGDLCAEKFGEYSMLPTDMINCISDVTKNISER